MGYRLHLLTAVTRPQNLAQLAASIEIAAAYGVQAVWHRRPDPDRRYVGGQALKNAMIEEIAEGWVALLDDDNLVHPAFFPSFVRCLARYPSVRLIAIAQQHQNGWVRQVDRGMLKQTHVDAGQVVIRRDAIGDRRIPLDYCGDGAWIEGIADSLDDDQITYSTTPATYYNWLRSDP